MEIATRLTKGDQCDTNLAIANKLLTNEIAIATDKNNQIGDLNLSLSANNSMLALKDKQIKDLALFQKQTQRTLTWTRVAWATTTIGIIVLIVVLH